MARRSPYDRPKTAMAASTSAESRPEACIDPTGPSRSARRPKPNELRAAVPKNAADAKPSAAVPNDSSWRIWTANAPTRNTGRTAAVTTRQVATSGRVTERSSLAIAQGLMTTTRSSVISRTA